MPIFANLRGTFRVLMLPLALALTLGACEEQSELPPEEYLKRAESEHAKGEFRSAIVSLKNVLQKAPQNVDARLMLGRVYLTAGDGLTAEKEILAAAKLGATDAAVMPLLGRAWLLQNRAEHLLKEFVVPEGKPAGLRAEIQVLRGEALRREGKLDQARSTFEDADAAYKKDINVDRPHLALTMPPLLVEAQTGLAKVSIDSKDWNRAGELIAAAREAAPDDADVLGVAGLLEFEQGNYAVAEEAFAEAFKRQPYNAMFQIRLAHAQIAQNKVEEARKNLDAVLAAAPDHPYSNFLRGIVAYQSQEYDAAKIYSEKAIKVDKNLTPAHMIAGAANFALGQYEQAHRHLALNLARNPRDVATRRLLGAAQLRLGNPQQAYETLQPIAGDAKAADADLLSMIGDAAYQVGDFERAQSFVQKAVDSRPDDSRLRAQLGLTRVAIGDKAGGYEELERAIADDPSLTKAEVQLIVGYIRDGEYDKADKVIARLKEKSPDSALPYNLEAMNHLARKDVDKGKAALRQALDKNVADETANLNLAKILTLEKEYEEARTLYQRILDAQPAHLQALLGMAQVETASGDRAKAVAWMQDAVRTNYDNIAPRVVLMRLHFSDNEPQKAVELGSAAPLAAFENPAFLETYAEAQLATGRTEAAAVTARRLFEVAPDSPDAAFLLGRAAFAARDTATAKAAFDKVIALEPENAAAKLERAKIAAVEADYERAKEIVAELEGKAPDTRAFLALKSSIAVAEKRFDDAIELQKEIVKAWPQTGALLSLADLQWQLGRQSDSFETLESWQTRFPTDGVAHFKLGQRYMDAGRLDDAAAAFAAIVENTPNSTTARNNLAWVLLQKGELEQAQTQAEKAYRLAPQAEPVIDTYARVLLERKKAAEALPILETATRRRDSSKGLRFLLARAMSEAGRAQEAKRLLDNLLAADGPFPERAEAEALQKTLSQ